MPFHKRLKSIQQFVARGSNRPEEWYESVLKWVNLVGPIGTFEERKKQRPPPKLGPVLSVGTTRQKVRERQRLATQGFQTPQLTKVAETGTPPRQRQAREKMRRLGRRLKKRGVDF